MAIFSFAGARLPGCVIVAAVALVLGGCVGSSLDPSTEMGAQTQGPVSPQETKYYASDEDFQAGVRHFNVGAFGLAQESFQRAVERTPSDTNAWIGLAASYDRLRRFDLADRAYDQAIKQGGVTVTILNNRGYSYLLRGDLAKARAQFLEAYKVDPENPAVVNNMRLLDGSRRHVRRLEGAY